VGLDVKQGTCTAHDPKAQFRISTNVREIAAGTINKQSLFPISEDVTNSDYVTLQSHRLSDTDGGNYCDHVLFGDPQFIIE